MHRASRPSASRDLPFLDAATYAQWLAGRSLAVVPVGAFEQHGPHLPLGTDALLSTAVARGVADVIEREHPDAVKVAQTFSYGYKSQQKSGGGNHLPGTVSLDAATLVAMARDVTRSFLAQGLDFLVFLNGHYENYQFLYEGVDLALRDLRLSSSDCPSVLLLSYWDYVSDATLAAVYPDGFPGWDIEHGGVLETSLMLHLYPDYVSMERAQSHPPADLPKFDRLPVVPQRTPPTGCLSAPDGSSAEKGELLFAQVSEAIAHDLISEAELSVSGACSSGRRYSPRR